MPRLQREGESRSMEPVTKKPCIEVCEFNKKAKKKKKE
jgi:hypothetical protein